MSFAIPPLAARPGLPAAPANAPAPEPVLAPAQTAPVDRLEFASRDDRDDGSTASGRVLALARDNRELHFFRDEDSGRIVVQVRTLDGELVRMIPNDEALAVLAGKPLH